MAKKSLGSFGGEIYPIIGIGTSSGGLNALKKVINQLDGHNAAVFIVMHVSPQFREEVIQNALQKLTTYNVMLAEDHLKIKPNTIYLPVANTHLLVKDDYILIGRGPRENRWRPSINVLFRSLAVHYTSRVTGIILTGLLDDGMIGMNVIQKTGGTTVVQDPIEAEFPDMPSAVINNMQVDYIVPLAEMKNVFDEIVKKEIIDFPVPEDLLAEASISENVSVRIEDVQNLGPHSVFSCPDCGGGLWEINQGKITKYRCHIGHEYSESELALRQRENIESTLWISARMMEERRNMLLKMADHASKKGHKSLAQSNYEQATKMDVHINRLRELLFDQQDAGKNN